MSCDIPAIEATINQVKDVDDGCNGSDKLSLLVLNGKQDF